MSPEQMMGLAVQGRLTKDFLADQLVTAKRKLFLNACGSFERRLTAACKERYEPCLACEYSMEEEDACLNAVLEAGIAYAAGCGAIWVRIFKDPANRA